MNPIQFQQAQFYYQLVNQNPSFKHYVITMGYTTRYRTDQELVDFLVRVHSKRAILSIGCLALSYIFRESFNPN